MTDNHAALLEHARALGLRSIEVGAVAALCDPAQGIWVVEAVGTFRAPDGENTVWSALGDAVAAAPEERVLALGLAQSRAVARLLRLAGRLAAEPTAESAANGAAPKYGSPERPVRYQVGTPEAEPPQCAECGAALTSAQLKLSVAKFKRRLCPAHQQVAAGKSQGL